MVSSLQIFNHWILLKLRCQRTSSISLCFCDGLSAYIECEIHVSPPNFYFSEPTMS